MDAFGAIIGAQQADLTIFLSTAASRCAAQGWKYKEQLSAILDGKQKYRVRLLYLLIQKTTTIFNARSEKNT
jgi:hypothetical protein